MSLDLGSVCHRDCEGSSRTQYCLDNAKQPSPAIVCCLGYKLGDVDISKPMHHSAWKAMKKQRINTANYAGEAVQISDFNNMKFVKPIWSGAFKVKSEGFKANNIEVDVDAYLSSEACHKVEKFSRSSLPRVAEVKKVPRLEVWPKRWRSSGPTVPGETLPWRVFKRRKGISDKRVIVGEQDGSACAVEEGQLQEQHLSDQQDEVQRESPIQETSAMKLVGNQPLVEEYNPEAEKEVVTLSMTGGVTLPGSSWSHAKPNTPTAGSNSSVVHPKEVNMQQEEGFTSSPEPNVSCVAGPSAEECGHGQSGSVSEPPPIKLLGVILCSGGDLVTLGNG